MRQSQRQEKKSISTPQPSKSTVKPVSSKNNDLIPSKASLEKAYGSPAPKTSKSKSSLIAASKASYAEKYGTAPSTTNSTTKMASSQKSQKPGTSQSRSSDVPGRGPEMKQVKGPITKSSSKAKPTPPLPQPQVQRTTKSSQIVKPEVKQTSDDIEEDNYDDDFEEDYKSDFEEDPGSEDDEAALEGKYPKDDETEEDMSVSGLEGQQGPDFSDSSDADIADAKIANEKHSGFFQKKNSMDAENNSHYAAERPYSQDLIPTSTTEANQRHEVGKKQIVQSQKVQSSGFNFESAKKDSKLMRSRQLMNMLSLHKSNSVTLFHLGTSQDQLVLAISGTVQLHKAVQVEKFYENHDTQTNPIQKTNKWTQRPPAWPANKAQQLDIKVLREESLGVGTESVIDLTVHESKLNRTNKKSDESYRHQMEWDYDVGASWSRISNFISRASRKMLYVLESQKRLSLTSNRELEGSLSEVKLGRGLLVFNSLEMAVLTCSGDFLACANYYPAEKSRRKNESKSVVTIWSMKEPSCPKWFLRMWGKITAITLYVYGHIAVAGGKDGGLAIWDLDENPDYHKAYHDQTIRTATIDTAMLEHSHHEPIVGLQVVHQTEDSSLILSMDRSGILKSWSLHRSTEIVRKPHYRLHTAYWSRLNLCHKSTLNLNDCLSEKVLLISTVAFPSVLGDRITHCICGTVNGLTFGTSLIKRKTDESIIRKYYQESSKMNGHGDAKDLPNGVEAVNDLVFTKQLGIQKYNHSEQKSYIITMDINSSLHLSLVGSADGKCRLYSLPRRQLLITLDCGNTPLRVHFSRKRASLFYIALSNAIHIYDLLKSETKPWKTISIPNIRDLEIYFSVSTEFAVVLASNELKASMICGDISTLSDQEHKKFTSRLDALLC